VLLCTIVACSLRVADTRSRKKKIAELSACLAQLAPNEIAIGVPFLSGALRQGRIGLGYATVFKIQVAAAADASLSLSDADETFARIQAVKGKGSTKERERLLGALLASSTADEQQFLRRLLVGELRQGAQAGILIEAVARAAEVDASIVRRAAMLSGNLASVAIAALSDGEGALTQFELSIFTPLQPMLAQTCDVASEAIERFEEAVLDYKIDGARVQVHKLGDDVRVFTRRLKDVTAAVPEVVELTKSLPVRDIVLDGEVISLREDGKPQPFQTTMRRFGRKLDIARMREELPLVPFFFDCLHADGQTLIDASTSARLEVLSRLLPTEVVTRRIVTADPAAAEVFLDDALREGHEGIMVKALNAVYAAGSRGAEWLKIKPAHTLDLVVLAAEWGHGRREGWLSNLHLGARNPDGSFTMLGKTFKGMTDAMLRWQTEELQKIAIAREGHVVHVKPKMVVEVALSDVQTSPHYPGGLALRFARVKHYRPDKRPEDADTIETVRAIHTGSAEAKRRARS
jgi:DNA ligase-1